MANVTGINLGYSYFRKKKQIFFIKFEAAREGEGNSLYFSLIFCIMSSANIHSIVLTLKFVYIAFYHQ